MSNPKYNVSFLSFAKEKIQSYIYNPNQKVINWGSNNLKPFEYLKLYSEIPEHASSIDFITNTVVAEGVTSQKIDYWLIKKLVYDFNIFGSYALQVSKTKGGGFIYTYVDISKCRYSGDKTKIGYSENGWEIYKQEYTFFDNIKTINKEGIYIYKSNNSRELYSTPYYISAITSLDTMSSIISYHNNNASNGFAPSVVINMNNGIPDDETQRLIEKGIKDKFTGEKGQKFIMSFNESKDTAITIEKLDNDNLDQKFETLQKFIQNQIIVSHKITSGTLIGIVPENQGFSKTEYQESLEVFKDIVINGVRKEIEYSLSIILGEEVKFIDKTSITNNGGQA